MSNEKENDKPDKPDKPKPAHPIKDTKKMIRVIKDGFIYEYNERLAVNPECEVVDAAEVLPEPAEAAKIVAEKGGARKGLDLSTDLPDEKGKTAPELSADASRKLPK